MVKGFSRIRLNTKKLKGDRVSNTLLPGWFSNLANTVVPRNYINDGVRKIGGRKHTR